jgi:hypothetical protein
VFDDWRRAVGVSAFSSNSEHPQRKPSLASHIERAIAKLVAVRTEGKPAEFVERLGEFVRELDALLPDAQRARGDRRAQIVARLDEIDRQLLDLAREQVSQTSEASLRRDAAEELAPFASRMPADAYEKALELALSRLVRQAVGLPVVSFE